MSSHQTGTYCHGETPTMADCCLYAQVWNNRGFGIPLDTWPTIAHICADLDKLPTFNRAAPPSQPDVADAKEELLDDDRRAEPRKRSPRHAA